MTDKKLLEKTMLMSGRKFRTHEYRVTRWLPIDDETWNNLPLAKDVKCREHSDSPFNLTRLVYENEVKHDIKFLYEGLVKTYPSDKFCGMFVRHMEKNIVPDELKDLTFGDIGCSDVPPNDKILGTVDFSDEVDGVCTMMAFAVPLYKKDIGEFKDDLYKAVRDMYVYGYDLSSVERLEHDSMPEIEVMIVQMEARFSKDKFKVSSILHHVAPLKILKKIRKNGIVPKSRSSEFNYSERVYLFNSAPLETMLKYGEYKAREEKDDGFCLFTIRKGELDRLNKHGECNLYMDWGFSGKDNPVALFTYGNIPPSAIDNEFKVYMLNDMEHPIVEYLK